MEPGGLCNARAMSLMDSPTLQRSHNSSLPAADNPPGRPSLATYAPPIRTTPKTYPVLHRPVESTFIYRNWTERHANAYIAEAIPWSENGNHATSCCMGITSEEADAKLVGALRERNLIPEAPL